MEQQKCPHCDSTKMPIESLNDDGENYISCGDCKKTITYEELFSTGAEERELDVRINYYYDEKKEYAFIKMADWEKLLKLLQEGGAELHRS